MNDFIQQRFHLPIQNLKGLLGKAKAQSNAGLWFYNNKGRDVLFQLEGLCRIYRDIQDKKFFDKWYKEFKMLEDALGNMDYNESLLNEFSSYKPLKNATEKLYGQRFTEEAEFVSEILQKNGWLNGQKVNELLSGIQNLVWKDNDQDVIAFGNGMCTELDKLVEKYCDGALDMFKLEDGLHEFRRKLRWVSIYASAANGMIQLRPIASVPKDLTKYCTSEIVKSPYNALPKASKEQRIILIQSHYFYAMSWIIRQLSELKDTAFRHEAFDGLCKSAGVNDKKLRQKFLDSCKCDPADVSTIAESLVDDFIYRDFIPERICRDIMRSLA